MDLTMYTTVHYNAFFFVYSIVCSNYLVLIRTSGNMVDSRISPISWFFSRFFAVVCMREDVYWLGWNLAC